MSDSYESTYCPYCKERNFIAMGNQNDCTSTIGESPVAECWKCKKNFFWPDMDYMDFDAIDGYDKSKPLEWNIENVAEEMGIEDGLKTP